MQAELLVFVVGIMVVLALGCLLALVFGVVFLTRQNRQYSDPTRHVQTDLASMQMMFMTMRDHLTEQKDVARQFNKSLDKKIKLVREMIEEASRERQDLRKAQHRIAAALAKVHEELGMLGEEVEEIDVPKRDITERYEPAQDWTGQQPVENEAALEEAPPEPNADDFIDAWAGVDLTFDDEETIEAEAYYEPEEPQDAEAARNAFRSLLSLEREGAERELEAGNGGGELTPLEMRVYEYDDAGMRASEIAKELGVEKSHVRAILAKREAQG